MFICQFLSLLLYRLVMVANGRLMAHSFRDESMPDGAAGKHTVANPNPKAS